MGLLTEITQGSKRSQRVWMIGTMRSPSNGSELMRKRLEDLAMIAREFDAIGLPSTSRDMFGKCTAWANKVTALSLGRFGERCRLNNRERRYKGVEKDDAHQTAMINLTTSGKRRHGTPTELLLAQQQTAELCVRTTDKLRTMAVAEGFGPRLGEST